MNKATNLMTILTMLHARHVVTKKQMEQACNITSRTVLRYLHDLSEANVPVYYDREAGGYRLSKSISGMMESLTMDELVRILFALRYLSLRLRKTENRSVEEISRKLISRQPFAVDEILSNMTANLEENEAPELLAQRLNSISVQVAGAIRKDVRVALQNNPEQIVIHLKRPTLRFDKGWQVCGRDGANDVAIDLEEVESVQIVS